jgi:predicted lactoylglutathione lyase
LACAISVAQTRESITVIGYMTFGTNDFERSAKFYDALAQALGHSRLMEFPGFVLWGSPGPSAGFALASPNNGEAATVGNGAMAALATGSKEQVDRIYNLALELGGTDEGPPGSRMPNFYAGYFRDLDGNKLNAFHMG